MPWVIISMPTALRRPDVEQRRLHALAGERIERAERLVHQQEARFRGERAGQPDTLAHAAGQLPDRLVAGHVELDLRQQGVGADGTFPGRHAAQLQRQRRRCRGRSARETAHRSGTRRRGRRRAPSTGTPSTATLPCEGAMKPAATFSSEVLPQPERPISTTKSLVPTSNEASRHGRRPAARHSGPRRRSGPAWAFGNPCSSDESRPGPRLERTTGRGRIAWEALVRRQRVADEFRGHILAVVGQHRIDLALFRKEGRGRRDGLDRLAAEEFRPKPVPRASGRRSP